MSDKHIRKNDSGRTCLTRTVRVTRAFVCDEIISISCRRCLNCLLTEFMLNVSSEHTLKLSGANSTQCKIELNFFYFSVILVREEKEQDLK